MSLDSFDRLLEIGQRNNDSLKRIPVYISDEDTVLKMIKKGSIKFLDVSISRFIPTPDNLNMSHIYEIMASVRGQDGILQIHENYGLRKLIDIPILSEKNPRFDRFYVVEPMESLR